MEEVGHPGEGQEEDLGPHHSHPHPQGEWLEGLRRYQGLPRKEGSAIDDARAPAVCDGTQGIVR